MTIAIGSMSMSTHFWSSSSARGEEYLHDLLGGSLKVVLTIWIVLLFKNILKTYPTFRFEISFVNIISNNNLVNQGLAMIRQNVVNFLCCSYIYNDSISIRRTKAAKDRKKKTVQKKLS